MLATCDDSLKGKRDRALLLFAWASGGRRRSEVAAADMKFLKRLAPGAFSYELAFSKSNQSGIDRPDNHKPVGLSRIGVLCIGARGAASFKGESFPRTRVLARALAMELHDWILKTARQELLAAAGLTDADLELLRHEAAGHTSKSIGSTMNSEAKTINRHFQRVNAKLNAPDRPTATRIARHYGLV